MRAAAHIARLLAPDEVVESVTQIDPRELWENGIRGLILDLDNTLCEWQSEIIPAEIARWLQEVQAAGLIFVLASNTHNRRRLKRMSEALGARYVERIPKPRRSCFAKALQHLELPGEQVAVVGDQMFTDVLGGKRCGLHTIMVLPYRKREFVGTKITRVMEGALVRWFNKHGLMPQKRR